MPARGDRSAPGANLLFTCQPSYPPTDGFGVEPDLVTFTVVSVNTPGELFRCALAAP
jgi:hypothetical protein